MPFYKVLWLFLLLSLAFFAKQAVARPTPQSPEPIKIGVTGAFTGSSFQMGISMRNGIRMAQKVINQQGGILGRPIELIERDDAGQPERAVKIAKEFTNKDHVQAVIGLTDTPSALNAIRYYQEGLTPILIPVATAAQLTTRYAHEPYNYVFRVAANDQLQANLIAQEAIERDRLKKVAIFVDTSSYGEGGETALKEALEKLKIKPILISRFSPQERDMSEALDKAKSSQAEAILTFASGPQLVATTNGMVQQGWRIPILGSWTLASSNFIDNAGPNAEGVRMAQTFIPDNNNTRQRNFMRHYRDQFYSTRIPSPTAAAQGYDAMLILAQAMRQGGVSTTDQIVRSLENLRVPVKGVITTYRRPFTSKNHEAIKEKDLIVGQIRAGKVNFAHPQDKRRPNR